MSRPISPLPARIVAAVADLTGQQGRPPTVREVGAAVGLASTGHTTYYLDKLIAEGRLIRLPGARGLVVRP